MIWFIALLIFLNGYFVAAEFALVRLQADPAHSFTRSESLRARIVRRMLRNLDAYLSTAQLGITFTSIALGSIGEPYVSGILEQLFADYFPSIDRLGPGVSFGLALSFITMVQIIIGEQGPKSYGIRSYERVVGMTAIPMEVIYRVFFPIITLINFGSLVVVRLLGGSVDNEGHSVSEEQLRVLLLQGRHFGSISEREQRIMVNAMKLEHTEAKEIMVPRPDVFTVQAETTIAEARPVVLETGHSRIPVVDPDLDHCVGLLFAKDLLTPDIDESQPVGNIVRQPMYVPDSISAEKLLYMFQTRRAHMAITVDEFGGSSGIATLEDIIEELVGEIHDEFDPVPSQLLRPLGENRWRASGMLKIDDLEETLKVDLETDQDTLSGWITSVKDGFARRGDFVAHSGFEFVVESVERHRIASVLIREAPVSDND